MFCTCPPAAWRAGAVGFCCGVLRNWLILVVNSCPASRPVGFGWCPGWSYCGPDSGRWVRAEKSRLLAVDLRRQAERAAAEPFTFASVQVGLPPKTSECRLVRLISHSSTRAGLDCVCSRERGGPSQVPWGASFVLPGAQIFHNLGRFDR